MKRIVIVVFVILVAGGGIWWYAESRRKQKDRLRLEMELRKINDGINRINADVGEIMERHEWTTDLLNFESRMRKILYETGKSEQYVRKYLDSLGSEMYLDSSRSSHSAKYDLWFREYMRTADSLSAPYYK